MREAALAKKLGICYATCALATDWTAGNGSKAVITADEFHQNIQDGFAQALWIVDAVSAQRQLS